ncbi:alpha/beta hydrolase family protein [Pseudoalteromonas sp. PPB1]|uniref:alpha/beta hydrolase family protein n=1 Tax=Pseudoalteromonas sp. PPB1 TaxID=2756136 RepID=UPI0018918274|nr:prolyl oligopeptidase family serine peptidase [Pseudoalteromonas sp. PPB1]
MVKKSPALLFFLACCLWVNTALAASEGYQVPREEIAQLVGVPPMPEVLLNEQHVWMALLTKQKSVQRPDEAGLRYGDLHFDPTTFMRLGLVAYSGLSFKHVATGAEVKVENLPPGEVFAPRWSADGRYLAFILRTEQDGRLWVYDIKQRELRAVSRFPLNGVTTEVPYHWLPDSSGLVVNSAVNHTGERQQAARQSRLSGPVVAQSHGALSVVTDTTKSLSTEAFAHYAQGQLIKVPLQGRPVAIGGPAYFHHFTPSPDATNLLVAMSLLEAPQQSQPLQRTLANHPSVWQVWGMTGFALYELYRPVMPPESLSEEQNVLAAISTPPAVPMRSHFQWRADKGATVVWAQEGDAENAYGLYHISSPFKRAPRLFMALQEPLVSLNWGDANIALLTQAESERFWRTSVINPLAPQRNPLEVARYKVADAQSEQWLMTRNDLGARVVKVVGSRYLFIQGAERVQGEDLPYLDRFDARANTRTRIWQSKAPYFEQFVALLDDEGMRFITLRQSKQDQPNYFVHDRTFNSQEQITHFRHPYPALRGLSREVLSFDRGDGTQITGTLYLSANYDPSLGRVPVLMWVKSPEKTQPAFSSPHYFVPLDPLGPLPHLSQGYAVFEIDGFTLPDEQGNAAQLRKQWQSTAQAAVAVLAQQGIADVSKVAIGGQGAGATVVVDLLAHTDLFVTGLARSGTYNFTLAPFAYEQQIGTFWRDPQAYLTASPMTYADKIKASLLLVHGYQDRQPGRFAVQSERLFSALNDLGKRARLVLLPETDHDYTNRQDVLHMLWEQQSWLQRHFDPLPLIEEINQVPEALRFELASESVTPWPM